MSDLAQFQDAFALALRGGEESGLQAWLDIQAPGLAVYRNNVAKASVDALLANYPTIERLVGGAWLRACAGAFLSDSPPASPVLADYGAGFATFLGTFGPAADMPYLASVARLDRLWFEAHAAADAEPMSPGALPQDGEGLAGARLRLHPSVRLAFFDHPAASIWRLNRPPAEPSDEDLAAIAWRAEGLMLVRSGGEVRSRLLNASDHRFLSLCAAGEPLEGCATGALERDPSFDVAALVADLFELETFAASSAISPLTGDN